MAKVYANLVKNNMLKFSGIREEQKPEVLKLFKAEVAAGTMTKERFKELTGMDYE